VEHDYELGRLVEYLSHTPWWDRMAVLVSESGSEGIDHIDARRSIFLCAGPWCRRNYVSHRNASVPGLLKTAFRLLGVPPMGLADAAAADLSDLFAPQADPAPYRAAEVDRRLFVPPEE
jgi:hypothetical protein